MESKHLSTFENDNASDTHDYILFNIVKINSPIKCSQEWSRITTKTENQVNYIRNPISLRLQRLQIGTFSKAWLNSISGWIFLNGKSDF